MRQILTFVIIYAFGFGLVFGLLCLTLTPADAYGTRHSHALKGRDHYNVHRKGQY